MKKLINQSNLPKLTKPTDQTIRIRVNRTPNVSPMSHKKSNSTYQPSELNQSIMLLQNQIEKGGELQLDELNKILHQLKCYRDMNSSNMNVNSLNNSYSKSVHNNNNTSLINLNTNNINSSSIINNQSFKLSSSNVSRKKLKSNQDQKQNVNLKWTQKKDNNYNHNHKKFTIIPNVKNKILKLNDVRVNRPARLTFQDNNKDQQILRLGQNKQRMKLGQKMQQKMQIEFNQIKLLQSLDNNQSKQKQTLNSSIDNDIEILQMTTTKQSKFDIIQTKKQLLQQIVLQDNQINNNDDNKITLDDDNKDSSCVRLKKIITDKQCQIQQLNQRIHQLNQNVGSLIIKFSFKSQQNQRLENELAQTREKYKNYEEQVHDFKQMTEKILKYQKQLNLIKQRNQSLIKQLSLLKQDKLQKNQQMKQLANRYETGQRFYELSRMSLAEENQQLLSLLEQRKSELMTLYQIINQKQEEINQFIIQSTNLTKRGMEIINEKQQSDGIAY